MKMPKSSLPPTMSQVKMPELLQEPIKVVLSALEKKLRNLEKRKLKLKEYEKKLNQGSDLNEEQKKAASDLILVENSLVTVSDLQKNVTTLEQEYLKLFRKDAKRLKMEAERQAHARATELTQQFIEVQAILGSFNDEARQDFLNEENGACLLTEEDLTKLDQIYTLVNPVDEENKLSDVVGRCSSHLLSLIEEADTIAYGDVTYKDICSVLHKVKESGYFEKEKITVSEDEDESQEHDQDVVEDELEELAPETDLIQSEDAESGSSPEPEIEAKFIDEEETRTENMLDQDEIIACDVDVLPSSAVVYTNSNGSLYVSNGGGGGVILPPEIDEECDGEAIDFFGGDTDTNEEDMELQDNVPEATTEVEPEVSVEPAPMEFTPSPDYSDQEDLRQAECAEDVPPILNAGSPEFFPRNIQSNHPQASAQPSSMTSDVNGWEEKGEENPWQNVDNRRNDNRRGRDYRGYRGQCGRGEGRGGRSSRGRGGNIRRPDGSIRGGDSNRWRGGGRPSEGNRGGRGGGGFRGGYRGTQQQQSQQY